MANQTLIDTCEMAERIGGVTLWAYQLHALGIEHGGMGTEGVSYSLPEFIRLCDILTERIAAARATAVAEIAADEKLPDDLDDLFK